MHWLAKKTLLMLVLHPVLSPLNHWQTYHLITPIPLMITLILLVIILILLMIYNTQSAQCQGFCHL